MKPKKTNLLSAAASMMGKKGKKGGKRTFELHGSEHFRKANKARKTFDGGYPKADRESQRAGRRREDRNDLQAA
jgi:hypothetical protein